MDSWEDGRYPASQRSRVAFRSRSGPWSIIAVRLAGDNGRTLLETRIVVHVPVSTGGPPFQFIPSTAGLTPQLSLNQPHLLWETHLERCQICGSKESTTGIWA